MKNIKKQITLFLTLIVFISSFVFSFSLDKIYASGYDTVNEFQVSAVKSSTSKPKSSSYKKSKTTLNNKTSLKVNSGSFSTNSSSNYKSSSTKKNNTSTNKTTIKPDSGSFTTKPNTNYSTNSGSSYGSSSSSGSSSSVKPDSGSFSTKPNTNKQQDETKKENNTNSDYDSGKTYRPYGSWGRRTYIPMYGRGLFGYNPFRGFGYRMGISSMIMDIVMVITILIVAYIIFDMIRSRRNRK